MDQRLGDVAFELANRIELQIHGSRRLDTPLPRSLKELTQFADKKLFSEREMLRWETIRQILLTPRTGFVSWDSLVKCDEFLWDHFYHAWGENPTMFDKVELTDWVANNLSARQSGCLKGYISIVFDFLKNTDTNLDRFRV